MKNRITKHALSFGLALIIMAGCNSSTKTKENKGITAGGKKASVEVETFDAVKIKDQIVETINKMPGEKDVANFMNEAGASYIFDLTVPANQYEKMLTNSDQSFGLGMYSFDLLYASIYNRGDVSVEISGVIEKLINNLGLRDELVSSIDYTGRLKANVGNKDSIDYIVTEDMNYFHQKMSKGNQPGIYARTVIGSNVEALYILCQTTLLAKNRDKMLEAMSRQTERVNLLFTLLELMSGDEKIKPYFEQFKPVVAIFKENQKITEKELMQISPLMEAIRKDILK